MKNQSNFIPFAKPYLDRKEERAVLSVLRSGWLTTGKVALEFEREFREFIGAKHALAVNSATAGLHLSLESLAIRPKQLVITTPYTFVASAEVIEYLGAHPLFVDINETSYNIDLLLVEKAIKRYKKRIACILPVHVGGLACDMHRLRELARHYSIPIVEDAAHAFPVQLEKKYVGTFGELGVFSFYANKTITTGEGGMVVTDNDKLAKHMQILRLHGIDREVWDRYTSKTNSWYYQVVSKGFKYNLSDLCAAIGRVQLERAHEFFLDRKKISRLYLDGLADCDFLCLPDNSTAHAWHLFIIRLRPQTLTITRDEFINKLQQAGIGVSVHFIPLHVMPYFKKRYGFKAEDFPIAMRNYLSSISIPIYPGLSEVNVKRVIATIKKIGYSHHK
ncbi:MAG: DegT/DnrJ/EryC1/StrS aminotransferase family protein [Spirochaetales bacterium]|nr:DegT/DnrJ/EryC1/StrS aminotransferase family protein [Spirochaetales bacterium]